MKKPFNGDNACTKYCESTEDENFIHGVAGGVGISLEMGGFMEKVTFQLKLKTWKGILQELSDNLKVIVLRGMHSTFAPLPQVRRKAGVGGDCWGR